MNPRPSINWTSIKRAYQAGGCSLPDLSRKHNVALSTLQKRCCRERWRDQMQGLCDAVATSAMAEATQLGRDRARRGAAFIERCLRDDERFHARLMAELDLAEAGDIQAVRSVISAWRDLVTMTRANYGIDSESEKRPKSLVSIECVGEVNVQGLDQSGVRPLPALPDIRALMRGEGH